jgi:hypothetical protein
MALMAPMAGPRWAWLCPSISLTTLGWMPAQAECHGAVAKVVETHPWKTRPLQQGIEVARHEVRRVDRAPDLVREHQPAVLPRRAREPALLALPLVVSGQGLDGEPGKKDLPVGGPGLELAYEAHRAGLEVNVGPRSPNSLPCRVPVVSAGR